MGCTSSQPTPTRGIVPAPRQVFPTRTSETAKSITRLDRYADRRAVEQVLETKFGPQIISEHGRDVLLWRVEVSEDKASIVASGRFINKIANSPGVT